MMCRYVAVAMLASLMAFIGCVTVESTRSQLSSSDPREVQKAEQNILRMVELESHPSIEHADQQIEYVNLVSSNDLLLKIINASYSGKVVDAAARRLDFSQPGLGLLILMKYDGQSQDKSIVDKVEKAWASDDSEVSEEERQKRFLEQKKRLFEQEAKGEVELPSATGFMKKILDSMNEEELEKALFDGEWRRHEILQNRLISRTQNPKTLEKIYDDGQYPARRAVAIRLVSMSDKLKADDRDIIIKVLKTKKMRSGKPVLDYEQMKVLIDRLSAVDAETFALNTIKKTYHVYGLGLHGKDNDGMDWMRPAIYVASKTKDRTVAERIVLAFGRKVAETQADCEDEFFKKDQWSQDDTVQVVQLLKSVPTLDAGMMEALIANDSRAWIYCLSLVSDDFIYRKLCSAGCTSEKMEVAFLKKLSKGRFDTKLYSGVRFESTRKLVMGEMSEEMKNAVREMNAKAFEAIVKEAKSAAEKTFELDGFYLGMNYDDLKVVFAHHFPKIAIAEMVDGKGEAANYVFYIEGQNSPVCFARKKDKKVWQINLGKKLLRKWYQYDVQTPQEWAHAYSQETHIDMKYRMIEDDTTVYDPTQDRSYKVWFYQESYQYRHNAKEYRLVYFGEQKDFTVEGGLGGKLIKSIAARDFRYVRGDQGLLRIKIECD